MKQQFYEGMDLTFLPLFTLVLFVSVFLIAIVRMFVFRRAEHFDNLARLPIEDGEVHPAEVRHE
ncbi:MAG: CcoQ/FixQ family Cbb3-type cytochrome c oxidase assembly chaperone [Myxococcaceae bacterium]